MIAGDRDLVIPGERDFRMPGGERDLLSDLL